MRAVHRLERHLAPALFHFCHETPSLVLLFKFLSLPFKFGIKGRKFVPELLHGAVEELPWNEKVRVHIFLIYFVTGFPGKNYELADYILSGEGEYDDNGEIRTVKPGDVTYTSDGKGHSLENKSQNDLVFIALIINN